MGKRAEATEANGLGGFRASFEQDNLLWVTVFKEEDFKFWAALEELEKVLSQTNCGIGSEIFEIETCELRDGPPDPGCKWTKYKEKRNPHWI